MAWIESHQSLRTHRKVMEMAAELNKSSFTIIGLLHAFWWWAIDNAPLGDLSFLSPNVIEHGIGWREFSKMEGLTYSAGRFVAALVKFKFIDQGTMPPEGCQSHSDMPLGDGAMIHDWMDFCGDLMKKRIDRQKELRTKRLGEKSSPMEGRKVPPTVPYRTVPNLTLPKTSTKTGRFEKPTAVDVFDYAKSIGFVLNPQKFIDHYEANGWKVGRNPMRDWKATVRTWKSREGEHGQRGIDARGTGTNKFDGIAEAIDLS